MVDDSADRERQERLKRIADRQADEILDSMDDNPERRVPVTEGKAGITSPRSESDGCSCVVMLFAIGTIAVLAFLFLLRGCRWALLGS